MNCGVLFVWVWLSFLRYKSCLIIAVNRANGVTEDVEDGIDTFRSDKSMSQIHVENNNIDKEASKELSSDAEKKITNQHVGRNIPNGKNGFVIRKWHLFFKPIDSFSDCS